ncbi:hypothetical protein NPIL_331141 [Nephila pilipes]|uniref:Uncharacterized protein n=1 Tax=Nephila pilipes TaxID=299642 RepID=A0A8X6IYU6_NEPPI|nr:hypothetical protein NPIL_331141 [Nephila pilipes]
MAKNSCVDPLPPSSEDIIDQRAELGPTCVQIGNNKELPDKRSDPKREWMIERKKKIMDAKKRYGEQFYSGSA